MGRAADRKAQREKQRLRRQPDRRMVSVIMLFFCSAFLLISFKEKIDLTGIALAVIVPALIYAATMWLPRFFPADKLLLGITNFLCALGVLILYSTDVDAGTSRGFQQAMYYGLGIVAMLACIMVVRYVRHWRVMIWPVMIGALLLIALPLAIGTEQNGATNWINVGGTSLQPSEVVKLALVLILSYFMSRRRIVPWLGFSLVCLGILMLQKDLGTALIYYFTALILFYANTGNLLLTGVGLVGAGGAAVLGYQMFAHVKKRVAIWQNPWLYYETSGYQIAQILMAIASGGVFGVGLGLGAPRVIPVYFTDCIFAVICEQFGIAFGILTLLMYAILIIRGVGIAVSARRGFYGLIAMGATAMIGIQTFVIIGGVLKLIPLTGVTMPFVSYGGTSMISCMGLIGLLQGVDSLNRDDLSYDYEISRTMAQQAHMQLADEEN
ncbi:MAG: FtsW/RodA/SpoVE family cell cycle protein [Clostridiales bacterium]|nr:FtsW/RodA/SpoVE family cell cycle protein [Clostridiales bacterium]